jgi:hypothetical protein
VPYLQTRALHSRTHTPRPFARLAWAVATFILVSCSHAAPSPKTAQVGLDTLNDEQRRRTLESMTSALDTRPEYVDELFAVVRHHPKALRRFLSNAARDLREQELAEMTVAEILPHPESYAQMLRVAIDQTSHNPAAADVLAKVMVERREVVADMLTDRPASLTPVTEAMMQSGAKKPAARAALRTAMKSVSQPVAKIVVEDPDTVGVLMKAMLDAGVTRSVIEHSLASIAGK